jgi:hypothetical protein
MANCAFTLIFKSEMLLPKNTCIHYTSQMKILDKVGRTWSVFIFGWFFQLPSIWITPKDHYKMTFITNEGNVVWAQEWTTYIAKISQPHFGLSVRMKLTFPKVGTWSPPRLLKIQSLIAGVKTPRIEVFFISLESSWSVDVQNGLAWPFWTSTAEVMGKRRAGSQIANLIPNH